MVPRIQNQIFQFNRLDGPKKSEFLSHSHGDSNERCLRATLGVSAYYFCGLEVHSWNLSFQQELHDERKQFATNKQRINFSFQKVLLYTTKKTKHLQKKILKS